MAGAVAVCTVNRRHFLSVLAQSAAASALAPLVFDPERLLWVQGRKKIFLPSVRPATPTEVEAFGGLRKGDVITVEGRYAVNPITRKPTEHLQLFVVTSDVSPERHQTLSILRQVDIHPNPELPLNAGKLRARHGFTGAFKPKDRGWSHKR